MNEREFERLRVNEGVPATILSWALPAPIPVEAKAKASRVTKADVQRAIDAARAAGFDFDELEIGGVVLRRGRAVTPAVTVDEDAEIAAWAARHAAD